MSEETTVDLYIAILDILRNRAYKYYIMYQYSSVDGIYNMASLQIHLRKGISLFEDCVWLFAVSNH